MVVLRCTQQLLVRLKQFDDPPPVESTTRLGDWCGNILRMGRRHALIFISERSRLGTDSNTGGEPTAICVSGRCLSDAGLRRRVGR
ncbi:MAG: DUF6933 domain-containing protein [Vicinamibacteraceae bacterium]